MLIGVASHFNGKPKLSSKPLRHQVSMSLSSFAHYHSPQDLLHSSHTGLLVLCMLFPRYLHAHSFTLFMCAGVPVLIVFLCLLIFFPPQHVYLGRNGFLISISYQMTSEKMHQHFSIACAGSTNWGSFALSKCRSILS